ncbi:B3 domain-containing protein [Striga asiatica]|uniref:B3 domain-containing protein n=1 Tax=Striga asiatica TaxID=4170 RepID=A0A5A7RHE8_STRAF|nr:B3 domain-containing protein [Striga asiatica]
MKKVKPKVPKQPLDATAVRRSSRVADLPPRSYKEVPIEPMGRPRSYGNRRNLLNRVYASDGARLYAIQRAEDLQSRLDQDIPSFIKPMLQSHVTGGFWLGLPHHFCKTYLPEAEAVMFTLIDEDGNEAEAKYLGLKNGLSGGWRGFAIDHELVDGDAIVFQLVEPTTFRVYIVRVNEEGDGSD